MEEPAVATKYLSIQTRDGVTTPLLQEAVAQVTSQQPPPVVYRTYKWRWVVLALFSLNNATSNYIWIMSAAVADLMSCYYGVSETMVNLLGTSYMMAYIVLMLPLVWVMDRYGLRRPTVLSSAAVALGASLKVAGSAPQYFWVILLGQFISSTSNVVFYGGAPVLSEIWFPSSQRATSTAIGGTIAPQLGIMIAMGITPVIIHSPLTQTVCNSSATLSIGEADSWRQDIYHKWFYYQAAVAGLSVVTLLLTLCGFSETPPTPPSLSRQLESAHRDNDNANCHEQLITFLKTLLLFFRNGYFMLFLTTSGILLATIGAVVSIINEIVVPYFPDKDEQVGYLVVVSELVAVVSLFTVGRLVDWTKRYYLLSVLLTFLGTLFVATLVVLIQYQKNFYLLYMGAGLVGMLVSYQAVAYEYAVEMTYPLPEATAVGLVNIVSQVISIPMILLVTPERKVLAMWVIVGLTGFGALLTVFTKPRLRREEIDKASPQS